ncbi:MAG TPA: hypothetical protein VFM55_06640 [Micromonosporaceae bacterium]|nr:hypothetical protein [Micromonosporaceae bacterium]
MSADHFRYHDDGLIDPQEVLSSATFSLYCLDPQRREAIFVQVPAHVDLRAAPFYFQAQYDAAQGLVAVGYDTLHQLAEAVELDPARLVLVHSVGRCGSTLVSRAFAEAGGVLSLAEPDVLTQLVVLRETGHCDPGELSRLVRSCTRLVCAGADAAAGAGTTASAGAGTTASAPAPAGATADQRIAIKFRSFVVQLADVLHEQFPAARNVFLYRGAHAWSRSTMRAFGPREPQTEAQQAQVQDRLGRLLPLLAAYRAAKGRLLTPVEAMACHWVGLMEQALELRRRGVPMFAVRYEELTAAPHAVLAALFGYCGLPALPDPVVDRLLAADSQAGSSVSRAAVQAADGSFDPDELSRVIAELSRDVTPDLVLPGTSTLVG